jgi:hypothetical protein
VMTPLTTYIREAVEADPDGDPSDIAGAVLNALPSRQIKHYLLNLLVAQVKDILRLDGNAARNAAFTPKRGGVTRSPKYGERRSLWQQMLDSRVDINGETKRYGSCTRDELMIRVKDRETLIADIRNQISHDKHIISLMDDYGVDTPDELPEQELAS